MREIKFRAWFDEEQVMIPFEKLHIELEDGEYTVWYGLDGDSIQDGLCTSDFEFMQCTGLKDITGKEIYEGDYVVYVLDSVAYTGIVIFENGMFRIDWEKKAQYHRIELSYWNTKVNVDGNIFTSRSC